MKFTRKNAYDANNGGQFLHADGSYTDLYWYAKAVGVMKSRPISDCTSWWFYAAIHGEYVVTKATDDDGNPVDGYPNWKDIPSIPASADLSSMDKPNYLTEIFWDQCQHNSWYFLPWHRGYLVALEIILHKIIISLDGPSDWALPYWNYFKEGQNYIPPAFIALELPDGTPNPLYVEERYGPDGDGKPYAIIINQSDSKDRRNNYAIKEDCQTQPGYVGFDAGEFAMFAERGNRGALEGNPHGNVHNDMGGIEGGDITKDEEGKEGLMCDHYTAGLDPIFYIHHCNIDRMWAAWNEIGGNPNPTDYDWLKGPDVYGQRYFVMPMDKKGKQWRYTPEDVINMAVKVYTHLNIKEAYVYEYTFDDLSLTSSDNPATLAITLEQRLINLGFDGSKLLTTIDTSKLLTTMETEFVGAISSPLTLNSGITETNVPLDKGVRESISKSLKTASPTNLPNEVYLQLTGVKGINNSNSLAIYLNDIFVDSVALFGIRGASMQNGGHGGLDFKFDITSIVDQLHLDGGIENNLKVRIETRNQIMGKIKIGSISVFRVKQ